MCQIWPSELEKSKKSPKFKHIFPNIFKINNFVTLELIFSYINPLIEYRNNKTLMKYVFKKDRQFIFTKKNCDFTRKWLKFRDFLSEKYYFQKMC